MSGVDPEKPVTNTSEFQTDHVPQVETARTATFGDFIDYKASLSLRAKEAYDQAEKTGNVPFGTSMDILKKRSVTLADQVEYLDRLLAGWAEKKGAKLGTDLPNYWEMNEGDQDLLKQKGRATTLVEFSRYYEEEVINLFEKEFEQKFGGKVDTDEARKESTALDLMRELHNEMLDYRQTNTTPTVYT